VCGRAIDRSGKRALTLGVIVGVIVSVSSVFAVRARERGRLSCACHAAPVAHIRISHQSQIQAAAESASPAARAGRSYRQRGAYPVKLDALAPRIPNNRYWTLGAPTSDQRSPSCAPRAPSKTTARLGRITRNEATPEEIARTTPSGARVSRDYLELSDSCSGQGETLGARSRHVRAQRNLHRSRLQQIERDQRAWPASTAHVITPPRSS